MLGTLWIYTLVLAFICIGTGLILFLVWDIPSLRDEVSGRARLKQVHDLTSSGMGLADLYMVHNVNRDLTLSWKPVQEEMEKAAEGIPEPEAVSGTLTQGIESTQGIEEPKPIVSKHRASRFPDVGNDSNAGGVPLLEEMLDESKSLTVPDIEDMATSLMDFDDIEGVEETPTDFMENGGTFESVEETPTDTLNDVDAIEGDVDEESYVSDEDMDDSYDDIEETPTGFIDDIEENSFTTLLEQFSNKLSIGRLDVVEEQGNYDE